MAQYGSGEPEDESATGEVRDEVPPEWTRMLEREAAARRAKLEQRMSKASRLVPVIVLGAFALGAAVVVAIVDLHSPSQAPVAMPGPVRAFADALPASRTPNAAGVTVVDGTDAPNTWRVAWETEGAAFCFAFVHGSGAPQEVCDAPGSVTGAKMRIAGELEDPALTQPVWFTCGYTTGDAAYVEVDGGSVVGTLTDMGSGLSAYCVQLPDGTAPGAAFTVSTQVITESGSGSGYYTSTSVTATYH